MDMNFQKLQELVKDREAWNAAVLGLQRVRHDLADNKEETINQKKKNYTSRISRREVSLQLLSLAALPAGSIWLRAWGHDLPVTSPSGGWCSVSPPGHVATSV